VKSSHTSRSRRSLLGRPVSLAGMILLLLAVVLAGCSGAAPANTSLGLASTAGGVAAPLPPPAAPPGAPAAPAPALPAGAADASNAPANPAPPAATTADVLPPDRMVIRDAKLSLQVSDVEASLARVRDLATSYGGYVSNSHTSFVKEGDTDRMVADLTIVVRADSFDRAIVNIRQIATKVESEDGTSQDVTQEYVDLDANLRNLQASETAILKLTEKATNLQDVLVLERELSNVRGQIEKIQGRKQLIEHQTSFSTIAISMHLPPLADSTPTTPVWDPLKSFERGWHASIVALETLADVVISLVSFLWWTIPFSALGFYLYLRGRQRRPGAADPTPNPSP